MVQQSSRLKASGQPSRLAKLFSGWQAGLLVVVMALVTVSIAVPRPALSDLPLPVANMKTLEALARQDQLWSEQASREPLSFDVRALGEAIHQYGQAEADHDRLQIAHALPLLQKQARDIASRDPQGLLALRAYQTQRFLQELQHFEATAIESVELQGLAGAFVEMARRAHWLQPTNPATRLVADEHVRRALFRKRWNEITNLNAPPFALQIDEQRALYAFLLRHPVVSSPSQQVGPNACRAADEYRLRKVAELGAMDASYPAQYALGLLLIRLDRPQQAIVPLADFVERHENGPYVLRARNALREAQDRFYAMQQP